MPIPLHNLKRAAAAGGHRGSRAGNRGPATAGRWAPRPPGRQLETSGLGGAARAIDPRQLATPAVAGPRLPARRPGTTRTATGHTVCHLGISRSTGTASLSCRQSCQREEWKVGGMMEEERREEERREEWGGGGGGEGVKALSPSCSCAAPARAQSCCCTRAELRVLLWRHARRASRARMAVPARAGQGPRAKLHIKFSLVS